MSCERDELVLVARRRAVERPDLDGLDAARLDQLAHDLFRFAVEVVLVGETGVVEADAGVRFAPDQPVHGRVEVLSEQVPQGQVDGAQGPDFGAAGDLKIEGAVEIGPDPLDIARVAAEQRIGHRVNHSRLGGVARIRLSDTRNAGVGIDPDPGPVRPERGIVATLPVHRFDARDLRRRGGLGGGGIGAGERGGQQPRDKRPSAERHGRIIADRAEISDLRMPDVGQGNSTSRLLSQWRTKASAWGKPAAIPRNRVSSACAGYHFSGCWDACA